MGSSIQSCCGEPTENNKKQSIKKLQGIASCEIVREKSTTHAEDGPIVFTEKDIFRLLGSLILVSEETRIQDFQIQGILGLGAFGVVYLGQLKKNVEKGVVEKYAIKRIPKELLVKKNLISSVIEQRDILAMCNRFLVSLIMAFQDPWYLYLVMQCAIGGDTYGLIKPGSFKLQSFKNTGEAGVRFIAGCVILALECLHQNNYIYRDLKPQNVLIFQNGYVKLTDFGLVKKSIDGKKSQTISGTELYYAPEMVLTKGYNKGIDFWGLGIYLYELSNYEPPFLQQQITKNKFEQACLEAQKNRTWLNPNLSPQLKSLINNLLKFQQSQRIGVKGGWQQVKNHKFFQNFNWQQLEQGKMQSPLLKIVEMFPISVKPFYKDIGENGVKQTRVQGWSLVKKNTI